MKEFMGTFLACIVICAIGVFLFLGFILNNLWALIIFIAFLLSIAITIFVKQETRIENLEKNVERLLDNEAD